MSDTLLMGLAGLAASLATAYFSNKHTLKIKEIEMKQNYQLKQMDHDNEILDNFLSALFKLSTLDVYTHDPDCPKLIVPHEEQIKLYSEYKASVGPVLSLLSDGLAAELIRADDTITSLTIRNGLTHIEELLPLIRNEVKQNHLKKN